MASNISDRIPMEIWLQILEVLPPTNIWKLRMVSRAWNERCNSNIVVDSTTKRCGFQRQYKLKEDILEHGEELESYERRIRLQMLKGHLLGRPRTRYTFDVGCHSQHGTTFLKLCEDRAVCSVQLHGEEAEITLIDLDTGIKDSLQDPEFYVEGLYLTEQLCGGLDGMSGLLYWTDLTSDKHKLESEPYETKAGFFVAHACLIAGLGWSSRRSPNDLVRVFNINTKVWTSFAIDIDFGAPNKTDINVGLTLDDRGVTIFCLYCSSGYMLEIKRYTIDGDLQFEKSIPFESEEPFTAGTVYFSLEVLGEHDRYQLRSALDRVVLVDLEHDEIVQAPHGLTASWKSYIYHFDPENLWALRIDDGELQRNSSLDWPKHDTVYHIAVNDRWLCVLAATGDRAILEVFDFCEMSTDA